MPRKTRKSMHGGVYRKTKPTRKLRPRPIGHERPRSEPFFEYAKTKRIVPAGNKNNFIMEAAMNTVMNTSLRKTKKKKPFVRINLSKNIQVRKDTTYQYIKNIQRILKQIVRDAEEAENVNDSNYDILVEMAMQISAVLPGLKRDLGMNSNNNSNNNNNNMNAEKYFDDVEEIIEIIREILHRYDRALRKGRINNLENTEAEMELIASTLDSAIQDSKARYMNAPVNNMEDELSMLFSTLKPFSA
jgi:hypothetical protein